MKSQTMKYEIIYQIHENDMYDIDEVMKKLKIEIENDVNIS